MVNLLSAHDRTATIPSGQTTSGAVDGRQYAAWLAVMPAAFTGTSLSFQASVDGTTFATLTTTTGTTITVTVAASVSVPLPPELGLARSFKVVSNAAEGADRTIRLLAKAVGSPPVRTAGSGGGSFDGVLRDQSDLTTGATVTVGHALKVDGSAATQPVSGTFWQATQPVSGTFWQAAQPVTDNAGSLTVDAPVGTPVAIRTSDGSVFFDPRGTAAAPGHHSIVVGGADVDPRIVSNVGTFAVQDSQVIADNAAFADGTSKLFMGGFAFDETPGTALTENDAAAARVNANRAQVGIIEDGATRARYAAVSAANALKVDGSAVTQPVSGTFWQATQPVSGTVTANAGTGPFPVSDNAGSLTVDNAGTFVVQDSQVLADNAAFTDGTTKLFMAGYVFDEVAGTALTENDAAAPRLDAKRASVFTLEDETTRGTRLSIKAASTAPVAADKAAVVAVSPNSLVAAPAGGFGVASLPVRATAMAPATYVAAGGTQTTGALTANTEVILWDIEHAGAATKTVRIHRITADFIVTTAPAAAGIGEVRVYRGTAVGTGGSSLTGVVTNPARGAVEAAIRTNKPTITAATTLWRRAGWMAAAVGNWSYGNGSNVLYEWNPQLDHEPLTLRAGSADTVAIAVIHSSTPTLSYAIVVWFGEE